MRPHHRIAIALVLLVGLVALAVLAAHASGLAPDVPAPPVTPTVTVPVVAPGVAVRAAAVEQERLQAVQWQAEYEQYLANVAAEAAAQARAASRPAQAAVSVPQVAAPSTGDCGGVNQYAAYIYMRESGCRVEALNGSGCRGIGQACPGSKLPCGDDFACQHQWFEGYALGRYGSWEAAYQFWLWNHWW